MQRFSLQSEVVITQTDNTKLKGKLIDFKETTLLINSKEEEIEIAYDKIKKMENRKHFGPIILGVAVVSGLVLFTTLCCGS
jgi:hypothetical protein